ncbi:FimV/HubP family polar landmark protein [Pseudomonas abieticivorans]|uniref:FimV/HubP family polar landmark protein n=1 Tax=Pseudomonas abieticivorans TaxID=2931382 RepID=UPI0020BDB651|nr:FimV/HubP family polar landmark protein [Pseudomonas sp. PIA16]
MVQVRKLVLAIAAATALSSGMARALDLGEVTLKSAANQPLVAEIELLDVRDLTAAEIKPSLATSDEFTKAGVQRKPFLTDLTFTPVINAGGKSIIRVTSSQPLTEPLVKFLVQVQYPSGRLMRDYSVLLDPSKFSPQAAQAAKGGATPAVTAPNAAAAGQFTTSKRDTLWEIAQKNQQQGATVQQTMLAIQALNPDAFIDGNINLLKVGQVLRLPDVTQSTALAQPQAIAEVARQNAAWREGRRLGPRAQQLDATRKAGPGLAPAQTDNQDKLSLVAGSAGAGKGKAGEKLAVAQEKLDTTKRDNAELKDRMGDLQSQLDKLQKLIQLKNDQLAKLEAAGATDGAATPAPVPPVADAPINAQLAPATPESAATPVTPPADVAAPAPAPVTTEPVAPATADQSPGAIEKLLASPLLLSLLAGAAIVIFLLLLLLLARRRKAQLEAEKHMRMARALAEETDFKEDLDLPQDSFEGLGTPAPNVKLAPAMVAASAAAATAAEEVPAQVVQAPPSTVIPTPALRPAAEEVGVIGQADKAIAEGHLNEADDLLEAAVAREPQRSDLRLKLMEVYARQGDRDAFVAQERQLVANGQNHADVEDLKSRYPAMIGVAVAAAGAAALAAELDAQYVKDLLNDEPGAADPLDSFDSDFDLSLDDDDLDADDLSVAEPELNVADFADDLELDAPKAPDDLDFDAILKEQAAQAEPVDDLADFDLDIGADQTPALSDAELDAQLAELDDVPELDEPLKAPQAIDELELPEDFDLSLAEEMDATPDKLATERDDVSAELDALSKDLERPAIDEPFSKPDALDNLHDLDDELEFDYLAGTDETATKLDLARAYIDMGDHDGARDILDEVLKEGSEGQRGEAEEMLSRLV